MEFDIKYTLKDYFTAVKFNMSKAILALKVKKKYKFQLFVFRLISPFVIFGIVVYAWINKLRKDYKFKLSPVGMI